MAEVNVSKISNLNAIVVSKSKDSRFFLSTDDSFAISVPNLAYLIKFLIVNGFMSEKVLEGILSEINE